MNYSDNEKLLERFIKFAQDIIRLCKKCPDTSINKRLIPQLVGCTSSIGANYSEACEAESAKDFVHKIQISKKEAKESRFFLRLILTANPKYSKEVILLGNEVNEYIKIFSSIVSKFKHK